MNEPERRTVPAVGAILAEAEFGSLRWLAEESASYDALARSANEIIDLLTIRKIRYLLVGGLAVRQFVGERPTQDIDLVMAVADLRRMPELRVTYQDRDFVRTDYGGVTVDILFTRNRLFETVRKRFTTERTFGERTIPCATPEGLVLMKLYALPSLYRQGRTEKIALYENDVRMLLASQAIDVEPLLALLGKDMLASDVRELANIVADIRRAIDREKARPFGEPRDDEADVP